jgi:hypothetical protein
MNCFVSTVASANDSLLLPPAKPGMEITAINQSEDPMQKAVRDALIAFMSATAKHRPKPLRLRSGRVSRTPRPMTSALTSGVSPWGQQIAYPPLGPA